MMRYNIFFIAAILSLLAVPAAAAAPNGAMMAPVNAVLLATNSDSVAGLDSYYTADAVVIDEFAPYTWSGPTAASQWWGRLDKTNAKMGVAKVHAVAQAVKHYDVAGDTAYMVLPLIVTYTMKGKAERETGLLAMTLRNSDGVWKISSQSWATMSDTATP